CPQVRTPATPHTSPYFHGGETGLNIGGFPCRTPEGGTRNTASADPEKASRTPGSAGCRGLRPRRDLRRDRSRRGADSAQTRGVDLGEEPVFPRLSAASLAVAAPTRERAERRVGPVQRSPGLRR